MREELMPKRRDCNGADGLELALKTYKRGVFNKALEAAVPAVFKRAFQRGGGTASGFKWRK
jgi:hypothetical protein